MKTSRIALSGLIIALMIATPAFGWVQEPNEETGYYWGYDDTEEGPPFTWPELPEMPTAEAGVIWNNQAALKLEPYGGRPYQYELEDSFWYFGHWYIPDDPLYMSEDGWVSFDDYAVDGYGYPPDVDPPFPVTDDPNDIIAPLWQDNDPTLTASPSDVNRIYYLWDSTDLILTVQWHSVLSFATASEFDYSVQLQMGGQELLKEDDCGVLYSEHLIHFFYHTADNWTSEDGAAGIEDMNGEYGITYHYPENEIIHDGGVVRFGYRKTRDHDAAALEVVVPSEYVEVDSDVDPVTVICNNGINAETFDATLNVYDDEDNSVYGDTVSTSGAIEPGVDTIGPGRWSLWTPDAPGTYTAELIVTLDADQCPANDTCRKYVNALYAHDVGVLDLQSEEGPIIPPYPAGTDFTFVATVENFGCNEEFDIPVDIEVYDLFEEPDSLIWKNIQEIENLDWRGNESENTYVVDVIFPAWTTPSEHGYRVECRTELVVDDCPENDEYTIQWGGIEDDREIYSFALERISYDPVTGTSNIYYNIGLRARVSLKVYSIDGVLVKTLADETNQQGIHKIIWNGTDDKGRRISQGVYLVRMEAGDWIDVKKVVVY